MVRVVFAILSFLGVVYLSNSIFLQLQYDQCNKKTIATDTLIEDRNETWIPVKGFKVTVRRMIFSDRRIDIEEIERYRDIESADMVHSPITKNGNLFVPFPTEHHDMFYKMELTHKFFYRMWDCTDENDKKIKYLWRLAEAHYLPDSSFRERTSNVKIFEIQFLYFKEDMIDEIRSYERR